MARTLAVPTFVAGPQDSLAAADVYGIKSNSTINSIQDVTVPNPNTVVPGTINVAAGGSGIGSSLKAVGNNIKTVLDLVKTGNNYIAQAKNILNQKDLLSKLTSSGNLLGTLLKGVDPTLSTSILAGVKSASTIMATVNGVTKAIKNKDINSIASIGKLIGGITDNPQILVLSDSVTKISSLSSLVKVATSKGIPNSFGALAGTLTKIQEIDKMATQCMPGIIKACDFGSFKSAIEMTSPNAIKAAQPDVVESYATNYVATSDATYADMKASFDKADYSWKTGVRETNAGTDTSVSIVSIQNASTDFTKALTTDVIVSPNLDDKLLLLAKEYPKTTVADEVSKQFPKLVQAETSPVIVTPEIIRYSTDRQYVGPMMSNGDSLSRTITTVHPDGTMNTVTSYYDNVGNEIKNTMSEQNNQGITKPSEIPFSSVIVPSENVVTDSIHGTGGKSFKRTRTITHPDGSYTTSETYFHADGYALKTVFTEYDIGGNKGNSSTW